jgi:hypothetical protein
MICEDNNLLIINHSKIKLTQYNYLFYAGRKNQ